MLAPILLTLAFIGGLAAPVFAQDLDETLLTCGYLCDADGAPLMTATEQPPDTDLVTRIFIGAFSEACSRGITGGPEWYGPEVYDLTFHPSWAAADEPDSQLLLYRYFCDAGAYNERHVYLTWTADVGVRPVSFATPLFDVVYGESSDIDSALEGLTVTGLTARHELVNSRFDEETRTITEWSCWRGLCDASGRGEWVLDDDTFRLVTYDVDPTYDGEVNQFRLIDFSAPQGADISEPLPFEAPMFEDEDE